MEMKEPFAFNQERLDGPIMDGLCPTDLLTQASMPTEDVDRKQEAPPAPDSEGKREKAEGAR